MTDSNDDVVDNPEILIAKISKLLAVAEHPDTNPVVAASYRLKAENLIKKYRLNQEMILASDELAITPVNRIFFVADMAVEFRDWHSTLFRVLVEHVGAKASAAWDWDARTINYHVVGYDIDLRFLDLLWQSVRLSFISRITPEYDPALSEAENIYRLRASGIPRKDVAEKIWGKWTHSNSAKVGKVYKAECERRGETPALDGKGIHLKTFREVYAREFSYRVWDRLDEARNGSLGTGGTVELAGRDKRVEEAFYELFPQMRPAPYTEPTETSEVKESDNTPTKVKGPTKAQLAKESRMYDSAAARAASRAGREAADSVNISRVADRTERLGYEGRGNS